MTNRITCPSIKKSAPGPLSIKWVIGCLLSTSILVQSAYGADQEWWFDVEVILFKRDVGTTKQPEKFKQSSLDLPSNRYLDILTPYLTPDISYLRAGLPYCRASKRHAVQTEYQKGFTFPSPAPSSSHALTSKSGESIEPEQANASDIRVNTDENNEQNFQYEVATNDIFEKNDKRPSLVTENVSKYDNLPVLEQVSFEQSTEMNSPHPPIEVEFIEWQIPSEILCSYSELIDPSFDSLTYIQAQSETQTDNALDSVPQIIEGIQWQKKRSAFLLPSTTMNMRALYEKLRKQRDITPILHVNWRQEVNFGRENGQNIRLFAGKNFAEGFTANGLAIVSKTAKDKITSFENLDKVKSERYIPEAELIGLSPAQQQHLIKKHYGIQAISDSSVISNKNISDAGTNEITVQQDIFKRIDTALADPTPLHFSQDNSLSEQSYDIQPAPLKELWQIDGTVNVYLRNVGRVPYLHIDSNFDFRQPIFDQEIALQTAPLQTNDVNQNVVKLNPLLQDNFLQSANFNQLRRVISKQVHYFDHPLFGMVVRINRYRWPVVEETPLSN